MKKIYLNRDKRAYVLIDDEDYELISQWGWMLNTNGYAYRQFYSGRKNGRAIYKSLYMHRLICKTNDSLEVDHINRNKLDNRRCNLRPATRRENILNRGLQSNNTSGYQGVRRQESKRNPWRVTVKHYGKEYFVGVFKTASDAYTAKLKFVESMGG